MKQLIKILKIIFFTPFFVTEVFLFKSFRKKNSRYSHQYMIHFFSLFGAYLNICLGIFLGKKKVNIGSTLSEKIFLKKKNIIVKKLNNYGYHIQEKAISKNQIIEVKRYLKKLKGYYISDNHPAGSKKYFFNEKNPKAVKFFYESNDLIKSKLIQDLAFDRKILSIAEDYLGTAPILDIVTAWWSVPSENPDKKAAQFWHFDMDRPTWLKVFFYLTDCNEDNGPHCYISGTHLKKKIPFKLRYKGYSRLNDFEIVNTIQKRLIKKFTTNKGSVLFEDSSGLHKGLKLKAGSRLILQFQYSSSLFGANVDKLNLPVIKSDNFVNVEKNYKQILEIFR
jgi:ectoine hydroxylase-related dioxygenase (phytanoyl-CoA dioxygenase family)